MRKRNILDNLIYASPIKREPRLNKQLLEVRNDVHDVANVLQESERQRTIQPKSDLKDKESPDQAQQYNNNR